MSLSPTQRRMVTRLIIEQGPRALAKAYEMRSVYVEACETESDRKMLRWWQVVYQHLARVNNLS